MSEVNKVLGMLDFVIIRESGLLSRVPNRDRELVVPEEIDGVTIKSIGQSVFYNRGVKVLKLPEELEEIENGAFSSNQLEHVVIPRKLKKIGYMAFSDNPLLSIVLPPSLEFIDDDAFNDTTDPLVLVVQKDSYAHEYASSGHNVEVLTSEQMAKYYAE